MQVDKITQNDLSIFHVEEDQSIFHQLNFTQTNGGREYLRYLLSNPLPTVEAIADTQQTIQHLLSMEAQWPVSPTNGTIMVLEKYYETAVEQYPSTPEYVNSRWYKFWHKDDYSFTLFSVQHTLDFVQGMQTIAENISTNNQHTPLKKIAKQLIFLLDKPVIQEMALKNKNDLTAIEVLTYANFIRHRFKQSALELMHIYHQLDAYMSLAKAGKKYDFCFPEIVDQVQPFVEIKGLFHFLLSHPVDYSITLQENENFLFLTGANMAGKSTFIKASGIAVYLAHIGMGVPAKSMQLSYFDGLLSNIQVMDNIAKGESFFFNEVQRIKNTINRISDGKKWLILIDELFKGTNQQDAVKCSTTVIEGLRKMNNALFILSTHLYEIGEPLKKYSNIQFRYFETSVVNDQLSFSYQLKEGISNDRLGYLILKREGVVDLLENC